MLRFLWYMMSTLFICQCLVWAKKTLQNEKINPVIGYIVRPPIQESLAWANFDNVQRFATFPLPYHVYKKWNTLSLLEKVPFLIDRNFLINAKADYIKLCAIANNKVDDTNVKSAEQQEMVDLSKEETKVMDIKSVDVADFIRSPTKEPQQENEVRSSSTSLNVEYSFPCDDKITLQTFIDLLRDFQDEQDIAKFFHQCDTILHITADGYLEWVEYLLCRGYYDRSGRPFDIGEFDLLENIVLMDYRNMLNDPHNPLVQELIAKGEDL